MNSVYEYLFLRRPKIEYVCPALCEFPFSSSGTPIIVLEDIHKKHGPTGLILGGTGNTRLSWDAYPGALCYTVYKAVDELDPFGPYQIVAECISDNFIDLDNFGDGVYRITAITLDGETDPSDSITFHGGGGGRLPLAWWAFEDVVDGASDPYFIYDSVNTLPAGLFRVGEIRNAPPGAVAKGFYATDLVDVSANCAWRFDAGFIDTPPLDPVDLSNGFAFAYDFTNYKPSPEHFLATYTQFRFLDASNAMLGEIFVMASSVPAGEFPAYPLDGSPNIDQGPGIYVWAVYANGTLAFESYVAQDTSVQTYHNLICNYAAPTGTIEVQLDGVQVVSGTITPFSGTCDHSFFLIQPLLFGFGEPGLTAHIRYDELSLWPFKLTNIEVASLWNGGVFQTWPMV
jgi:hypothetical protein